MNDLEGTYRLLSHARTGATLPRDLAAFGYPDAMPQTLTVTFIEAKGSRPPEAMTNLISALAEQGIHARLMRGTVQQDVWLVIADADLDSVAGRAQDYLERLDGDSRRWTFSEVVAEVNES